MHCFHLVPGFQDVVAGDIEAGEVDLEHHRLQIRVAHDLLQYPDVPSGSALHGPECVAENVGSQLTAGGARAPEETPVGVLNTSRL